MADVYEALRASPKVGPIVSCSLLFSFNNSQWENTLFLITYDEHGGFYDHVPPPQDGVPAPDDHVKPALSSLFEKTYQLPFFSLFSDLPKVNLHSTLSAWESEFLALRSLLGSTRIPSFMSLQQAITRTPLFLAP